MISDNLEEFRHRVLEKNRRLVPLDRVPVSPRKAGAAAIIISHGRPDRTNAMVRDLKKAGNRLKMDIFVIHTGPGNDRFDGAFFFHCENDDLSGECFGYNLGLRLARCKADYRYYWMVSDRMAVEEGMEVAAELVGLADSNPRAAVLYPSQTGSDDSGDLCPAISCPYSGLLVRAGAFDDAGFLNPGFKYNLGAAEELAFKLYSRDRQMVCCNNVKVNYSNGAPGGFWQEEDLRKAKAFAARYFVERHGTNWDEEFANVLPAGLAPDSFTRCRREWEAVLEEKERRCYAHKTKPGPGLKQRIEALHPWYYEVTVGDFKVLPGQGSNQTAEELRGRVEYRSRLMVDEVVKQYDFSNKRLLDIASNCGYWSARYAEMGARSLLAVEGRLEYVNQGLLYWDYNQFMKKGSYEFIRGNVTDDEVWEKIRGKKPFDFTLCAGILYHIPDHERLIRLIASVTEEAILIDTRVSENDNYIEEPGGWCFDAITETRIKRVPNLKNLVNLLDALDFKTEKLSGDTPTPVGLKGVDDYSKGNRVTLLAKR